MASMRSSRSSSSPSGDAPGKKSWEGGGGATLDAQKRSAAQNAAHERAPPPLLASRSRAVVRSSGRSGPPAVLLFWAHLRARKKSGARRARTWKALPKSTTTAAWRRKAAVKDISVATRPWRERAPATSNGATEHVAKLRRSAFKDTVKQATATKLTIGATGAYAAAAVKAKTSQFWKSANCATSTGIFRSLYSAGLLWNASKYRRSWTLLALTKWRYGTTRRDAKQRSPVLNTRTAEITMAVLGNANAATPRTRGAT
mmetsp:Transcript_23443/g.72104  ORF Transcript_23443/g.72104 Transcript_23443/m.72104 type:complete len:258 (-) Transcript_23443:463-1236(-)